MDEVVAIDARAGEAAGTDEARMDEARADEAGADEARADDYMAAIWNDPRFEDAISRGLADGNQADNYEDYNDEFDA